MVRPLKRAETQGDWTPAAAPEAPGVLKLADAAAAAVDSPARRMQLDLEAALGERDYPRWSGRRTLAFVVLSNGLFWIGAIWGILKLF